MDENVVETAEMDVTPLGQPVRELAAELAEGRPELHSLDARRTLIEEGRRAGAVSSKMATRRLGDAVRADYAGTRIDFIVGTWINAAWLAEVRADWLKDRNREEVLVGLGFDSTASVELRETIEGRVKSAEDEIRRTVRRINSEAGAVES